MVRRKVILGVIAIALIAPRVYAQATASGAAAADVPAVNPGAIQALKDMGAHLQTLKRFEVRTELTGERVLADGQKLQHSASAEMQANRPNKLRVRMSSARSTRELIYDGKVVTLYTPARRYYSQIEYADTLGAMVKRLKHGFGVEVPLADLFLWGTPAAPVDQIESAMNAGQDVIGNDLCDHYAFRQGPLDWQIWIAAGGKPLPRKIVITNRADEARPQSVSMIDWNVNPTFKDAIFSFTPPKGSTAVEIVPLKTN